MKDRRFVEKRLTDEQAELAGEHWEQAMRLAKIQAKRVPNLDLDWELGAAIAICGTASRFNAKRGFKFWTLARRRIKYAFIDMIRENQAKGFRRSQDFAAMPTVQTIDREISIASFTSTSLAAMLPADEDPIGWANESIETVYRLSDYLPRQAREIVRLYYCHGLTNAQAGERLGISETWAARIHRGALARLRKVVDPEVYDRRAAS